MDEKLLQYAFLATRRSRSFDFRPSLRTDRELRFERFGHSPVFAILLFLLGVFPWFFLFWAEIVAFIPFMIIFAVGLFIAVIAVSPSGRWLTNRRFLIERRSITRHQTLRWSEITSIERHSKRLIFQTPNEQLSLDLRFSLFRLQKEGIAFLNGLIRSAEANQLDARPIAEARDQLLRDILRQELAHRLLFIPTVFFFFVMILMLAAGFLIRQGLDYLIVNRPEFLIGLVLAILVGACVIFALTMFLCRKCQNREMRRRWKSLCAFFRDSASIVTDHDTNRDTSPFSIGSGSGREPLESLPIRLEPSAFQELLAQQARGRSALVEELNRRERQLSGWALFDLSKTTTFLASVFLILETVALMAGISILTSGDRLQVGEICFLGFFVTAVGGALLGILACDVRSHRDKFQRCRAALCRRLIPIPSSLEILPNNIRVWTFIFQPDTRDLNRTMNPNSEPSGEGAHEINGNIGHEEKGEKATEDNITDGAITDGDTDNDFYTVDRRRCIFGGLTRNEFPLEDNEGIVFYDPADPSQNLYCGILDKSHFFDESANRWDIRPEQRRYVVVLLGILAAIGLVLNILTFFAHLAFTLCG